jgi:hypothetical protein
MRLCNAPSLRPSDCGGKTEGLENSALLWLISPQIPIQFAQKWANGKQAPGNDHGWS